MAVGVRIELTNAGIKIPCLATWRTDYAAWSCAHSHAHLNIFIVETPFEQILQWEAVETPDGAGGGTRNHKSRILRAECLPIASRRQVNWNRRDSNPHTQALLYCAHNALPIELPFQMVAGCYRTTSQNARLARRSRDDLLSGGRPASCRLHFFPCGKHGFLPPQCWRGSC